MGRVSEKIIERLCKFLDSLPEEAKSKCTLCNETLTHIVKQAEVQTGAGRRTVANEIAARHNETALPLDKVTGKALDERVRQKEGIKREAISSNGRNSQSDIHSQIKMYGKDTQKIITLENTHVGKNTGENEWYTPAEYINAARKVMGKIGLDPASSDIANKTVRASRFYTREDSGLTKEWSGNLWMNPPYEHPLISQFTQKLCESLPNIHVAIVLVNNATETTWFQNMAKLASAICFTDKRIRFLDPAGNPGAPLQGQAILYFGDNIEKFSKEFGVFGFVVRHV